MAKCPVCKVTIEDGQRLCGNCRAQIVWYNGQPRQQAAQFVARVSGGVTVLVWGGLLLVGMLWVLSSLWK